MPDLLHAKRVAIVQNPDHHKNLRQLAELDDELARIIQTISESKSKHSFYGEMCKSPTDFVRKWASSQQRDMQVIVGDYRYGYGTDWVGEEFRRGGTDGVWGSQNVRESVGFLVSKR
jgi:SWI/SNF-related matrix-associated actin-dependent regulator of chromatin subfamily D